MSVGESALVAVGWLAGYAAFLASGEMAAAYFIGHFPHGFWPIGFSSLLAVGHSEDRRAQTVSVTVVGSCALIFPIC